MERFIVDIVGLTHSSVEPYYEEYVRTSVGHQLTLRRDEHNVSDPFAVKVKERDLHVGYVAVSDLDVVHQALTGSHARRLEATVVGYSDQPPLLRAEVTCKCVDNSFDPYAALDFNQWEWKGKPMLPPALLSVSERADDLLELLENKQVPDHSLELLFQVFLEDSALDTSREMTRLRWSIGQLLEEHAADEHFTEHQRQRWQAMSLQLRRKKGLLMSHDTRQENARLLFIGWPKQLKRSGFEQSHYTLDDHLDELQAQLQAFPFHLYDTFLHDPVDFLRETFYKHIPRHQLFGLLSGIILMILKGRASITRWGKYDDEAARHELENIVHETADRGDRADHPENTEFSDYSENSDPSSPSEYSVDRVDHPTPEEKAEIMKRALDRILLASTASGKRLVTKKNQWTALANVLINEYDFPYGMKDFCRLMDEWGFGKDGVYPVPCIYSSIAGYSERLQPDYEKRKHNSRESPMIPIIEEFRRIIAEEMGNQL